jgi:DNA-binding transcriptional LysR family regulator
VELNQVAAFVAIARLGTLTRAAAALHLSQPAVSRRLGLLEHELGAPAFERVRGGVLLTEAGRAFLPYAEAAMASMRDGLESVRALEREDRGTITLALVGTLASTALTERLRDFRAAHSHVQLRLRTAISTEVSALVRRGDATFGLRYLPDRDPDLVSHLAFEENMVTVCTPRHRLAGTRRLRPQALAGEPWIAFPIRPGSSGEPYVRVLDHLLAASGLSGAEIVAIDSLTAQKRLIEAGFGLGLVPESSIIEEVRQRTLRVLNVPALRATIPVALVHRRAGYLSRAARRLMSVLVAPPRGISEDSALRRPGRNPRAGSTWRRRP